MLENKKSIQWEEKYKNLSFVFTNSIGNTVHTSKINQKLAHTVQFIKSNDKYTL